MTTCATCTHYYGGKCYRDARTWERGEDETCRHYQPKPTWTCPKCGRNKFDRQHQSHRCAGGFRKRRFDK